MVVSISVVVGRQGGRRGWQAVALNRKETIESVKFAVPLWKQTTDEGGLAWDDSNNNAPSCGVASAPVLEEIADQPTGACAYHDRVRLGQGLQAGGEGMLFMEAKG